MNSNEVLIDHFYAAFKQRDYKTMQAAYHRDAVFNDPVFRNLSSAEVKAMWEMLIGAGNDLKIAYNEVHANDRNGSCHWEAWYTFTATGRQVHNVIEAAFEFREGKIYRHNDHFDFWRWSRMALGMPGVMLGWSPMLLNKVRAKARKRLDSFISKPASAAR